MKYNLIDPDYVLEDPIEETKEKWDNYIKWESKKYTKIFKDNLRKYLNFYWEELNPNRNENLVNEGYCQLISILLNKIDIGEFDG